MPVVTVVAITGTRWIGIFGPSVNCALSGPTRATAACVIAATGKVTSGSHTLRSAELPRMRTPMKRAKKMWWSSHVLSKNCVRKNSGMSRNWRPKSEFEMMSVVMKVSFEMAPPPLCHARTQDPDENASGGGGMAAQLTGARAPWRAAAS